MMEASLWNKEFYPIKRKYRDESKVRIYTSFHFQLSSSILQINLTDLLRRSTNPRDGNIFNSQCYVSFKGEVLQDYSGEIVPALKLHGMLK